MRRMSLLAILCALSLTGCIQFTQTVTLHPDGSGFLTLVHGMSEQNTSQLNAMVRMMLGESVSQDTLSALTLDYSEADLRREFQAHEAYGVTLESYRVEQREGWRYKHLRIRFKSLSGLARTGWLDNWKISLSQNTNGHYVFTQTLDANSFQQGELAILRDPQLAPLLAQLLQGFHAIIQFNAPGRILDATALRKTGRSARWVFDLDRNPDVLQQLPTQIFRVVFEGKDLNLSAFRFPAPVPTKAPPRPPGAL